MKWDLPDPGRVKRHIQSCRQIWQTEYFIFQRRVKPSGASVLWRSSLRQRRRQEKLYDELCILEISYTEAGKNQFDSVEGVMESIRKFHMEAGAWEVYRAGSCDGLFYEVER